MLSVNLWLLHKKTHEACVKLCYPWLEMSSYSTWLIRNTIWLMILSHIPSCMLLYTAGNDTEESGWKMVSGDVFRPPKNAVLLCVQIGSGVQIITSAFATLFFAALGKIQAACDPTHTALIPVTVPSCQVISPSLARYHIQMWSAALLTTMIS